VERLEVWTFGTRREHVGHMEWGRKYLIKEENNKKERREAPAGTATKDGAINKKRNVVEFKERAILDGCIQPNR
jgi:hypothetical protein